MDKIQYNTEYKIKQSEVLKSRFGNFSNPYSNSETYLTLILHEIWTCKTSVNWLEKEKSNSISNYHNP